MKTKLFLNCKTEKERKQREQYLEKHKEVLDLLIEIFEKDLRLLEKEASSTKRYDDQSWPYKQADYNGCKRTYEEVLNLLKIGE